MVDQFRLTTHGSRFTVHEPPLTVHFSLLTFPIPLSPSLTTFLSPKTKILSTKFAYEKKNILFLKNISIYWN